MTTEAEGQTTREMAREISRGVVNLYTILGGRPASTAGRGCSSTRGSEFVLACDMRFAARESAIFGQFEPAFGLIPGGGPLNTSRASSAAPERSRSC